MLRHHSDPRSRGPAFDFDRVDAAEQRALELEALLNEVLPGDDVDHAAAIAADANARRAALTLGDGPGAEALTRQLAVLLPAFGLEPSCVALQIDEHAAEVARQRGTIGVALAGRVYLDPAAFDPNTAAGREVLAHELAHVAQWRLGRATGVSATRGHAELEAASLARLWVGGHVPSRPSVGLGAETPATFMLIESVLKGLGSRLRGDFFGTLAQQLEGTIGAPLIPTLERWAGGELEAPEEIPDDTPAMERAAEAVGAGSVEALEATGKVTLFFIRAFFGILNKLGLLPIGFRSEAGPFALQVGGTATFKTIEMWGRVELDFAALHGLFGDLLGGASAVVAAGTEPTVTPAKDDKKLFDALGSKKSKVDPKRDVDATFPWKDPIGGWSVSLPTTDTSVGGWESGLVDMHGVTLEAPRLALPRLGPLTWSANGAPLDRVVLAADRLSLGTKNALSKVRFVEDEVDLSIGESGGLDGVVLAGDVDLGDPDAALVCNVDAAWVELLGQRLELGALELRYSSSNGPSATAAKFDGEVGGVALHAEGLRLDREGFVAELVRMPVPRVIQDALAGFGALQWQLVPRDGSDPIVGIPPMSLAWHDLRIGPDGVRVVPTLEPDLASYWLALQVGEVLRVDNIGASLTGLEALLDTSTTEPKAEPVLALAAGAATLTLFGQKAMAGAVTARVDAQGFSGNIGAIAATLQAGAIGVGFTTSGCKIDAQGFSCNPIFCQLALGGDTLATISPALGALPTITASAMLGGVRYAASGFSAGDAVFTVGGVAGIKVPGTFVSQLVALGPLGVDWSALPIGAEQVLQIASNVASGAPTDAREMAVLDQNKWYDAQGVALEGDYLHPLAIAWVTVLRDTIIAVNDATTASYQADGQETPASALLPVPDPQKDPLPWIKPWTSWVSNEACKPAGERATSAEATIRKKKVTIAAPAAMSTLESVPMLPSGTSCKLTANAMLASAGTEQTGERDKIWHGVDHADASGKLDRQHAEIDAIRQRARDAVAYLDATLPTPVIVGVSHSKGDNNSGQADHWVVIFAKDGSSYRFADPAGGKCYTFTVDSDGILAGKGWKQYEVQTICRSKVAIPPPPPEVAEQTVEETKPGVVEASPEAAQSQQGSIAWFWDSASSLASGMWDSATGWMGSQASTEAESATAPTVELPPETDAVVTGAGTLGPPTGATRAEVLAETELARMGADAAKADKSTIEIAEGLVANEKNNDSTKYVGEGERADKAKIESGSDDIRLMVCSSMSGWTLAAAGYDIAAPLHDKDGKVFSYYEVTTAPNDKKAGKTAMPYVGYQDKYQDSEVYEFNKPYDITGRMLIDGQAEAVLAMRTVIDEHGGDLDALVGTQVHIIVTPGVGPADSAFEGAFEADAEGGTNLAVTGAAGAFELMGIGAQVSPTEARPGDFVQAHGHKSGTGHAYQIYRVQGRGAAWFGPGAEHPTPVGFDVPKERAWLDDVTFIIDDHTLAANVGSFLVVKEQRIEVNIVDRNDETVHGGGDNGGAGTSSMMSNGAADGTSLDYSFYGRLRESKWYAFTPATPPAASNDSVAAKTAGLEVLVAKHVATKTDAGVIADDVLHEAFPETIGKALDELHAAIWRDIRYRLVREALIAKAVASEKAKAE